MPEGNERLLTEAELGALTAVVSVQVLAGQSYLAQNGHLQVDPTKSHAYERIILELVQRGILPTDDIFATKSPVEEGLVANGVRRDSNG